MRDEAGAQGGHAGVYKGGQAGTTAPCIDACASSRGGRRLAGGASGIAVDATAFIRVGLPVSRLPAADLTSRGRRNLTDATTRINDCARGGGRLTDGFENRRID